jgi:UDP-glucuronate decarboxylase
MFLGGHDPVQTTKTSVHGAINMLGLAKRLKCRILQASTSEVYGDPAVHPQTEDYWGHVNPIGPRSCYDKGKRCAETLFFDYHRQNGLETKVARIFNTYGPRMHRADGRVVSFHHSGAGRRADHAVRRRQPNSLILLRQRSDRRPRAESPPSFTGPVNLGNPVEFTIRGLAELILKETGSRSKLVNMALPQDDTVPDGLRRTALRHLPLHVLGPLNTWEYSHRTIER